MISPVMICLPQLKILMKNSGLPEQVTSRLSWHGLPKNSRLMYEVLPSAIYSARGLTIRHERSPTIRPLHFPPKSRRDCSKLLRYHCSHHCRFVASVIEKSDFSSFSSNCTLINSPNHQLCRPLSKVFGL